jgi:hypothetical protein
MAVKDNAVAGVGVAGAAVRWARALHPVATAAHGAVVPERVARRCDHVAHVLVLVARRRCRENARTQIDSKQKSDRININ